MQADLWHQSIASMSVCQTGASNSAAAAGGAGGVTVFLLAEAVASLSEAWCTSVACRTEAVSGVDEGMGDEIPVGTDVALTEVGEVTGVGRRR